VNTPSSAADEPNDLRCSEYESLREELLQNKQYVFERPLVIIAAAGVAAIQLPEGASVLALPPLLISVLSVNLWFTVNRIRSNARIVGYIAAALEPANEYSWLGWENAVRLHRKWTKARTPARRASDIKPYQDPEAMPDAMTFYPMVLFLHIVPVVFAVIASGFALGNQCSMTGIAMFVLTIATCGVFAWLALRPFHPDRMIYLIEEQRAIWLAVLHEHSARPIAGISGAASQRCEGVAK